MMPVSWCGAQVSGYRIGIASCVRCRQGLTDTPTGRDSVGTEAVHKQQTKMKKVNTSALQITAIAYKAACTLWDATRSVFTLSHEIVDLVSACDCDVVKAGEAFGLEWAEMGGSVDGGLTTALLTEACLLACLDQKEARQFIGATGVVSRQQAHKKGVEIYEGKKAVKSKDKPKVVSFKSLESDIKSLTKGSLTKEQAMALAKLIAAAV